MAYNKVIYDGTTLIDLTPTTAQADQVVNGEVFFLCDGTQATGTLTSIPIDWIEFDWNIGYISNGSWIYENPTNTYIDIYEVLSDHTYFLTLGGNVGSRFRSMFTTTDIRTVTSGTVVGTSIINLNNPTPYRNATFKASADGYLLIAKDNVGKTGVKTYVYHADEAWA